jgi:hypothetical protein
MIRRSVFLALWLGFIAYGAMVAPGDQPETMDLILRLVKQDIAGINPLIVCLFNVMGVLPLIYGCLMFADGREQPQLKAWPFVAGSMGVGAFAILPYLALRQSPPPTSQATVSRVMKLWDSRWTALVLAIAAIALIITGLTQGNWADFVTQWQTSKFIHVMSLDFCALSLLLPTLVPDDMARRGMMPRNWIWPIVLVPLLGTLGYLISRPALESKSPVL